MTIDKMVMTIIEREEADDVLEALIAGGYTPTIFGESRGGVLRQARPTLFIGVEDQQLEDVLSIIRSYCRSHVALASTEADTTSGTVRERTIAEVGSAVVFVWDLDRFETY
jgi:uncharacterized protein YaaQ